MMRPKRGCLALVASLLCAGCIVSTTTRVPPTAALITATAPPTTNAPASATAMVIVTPTATIAAPATVAIAASDTPASPTAALPGPTSTPIASETKTAAATTVNTSPPPPATALAVGVVSFSITPQQINAGDSVTLTWQAIGQQAAIYRTDSNGQLTDMHNVPLSGTLTIKTPDFLRNRVDYVLFAGAGGSHASAIVSAIIKCPDKWFFANPPAGCPLNPGTQVPMASEHFEHGLMLWLSSRDQIYLLYGDGGTPHWANMANKWFQGQPESDPSLVPPAGLFQPVRGFGLAWRGSDDPGGPAPRSRLGWGTEPEAALTGGLQCASTGKYNSCYISGPGGVVYVLKTEGSGWEVWKGP